jgi:RimJ/RimL family protein N-acetyltransferase
LVAEIHKNNEPSKQLFERCGFHHDNYTGDWIKYVYEM